MELKVSDQRAAEIAAFAADVPFSGHLLVDLLADRQTLLARIAELERLVDARNDLEPGEAM